MASSSTAMNPTMNDSLKADYLDDLPAEILQTITNYLPNKSLCAIIETSRSLYNKIALNRYFWKTRFLLTFDQPLFFDKDIHTHREMLITDYDHIRERETKYDYGEQYRNRIRVLLHKQFKSTDMEYILAMLAEHNVKNYLHLAASPVIVEFLYGESTFNLTGAQMEMFYAIKSVLVSALGFIDIPPTPLDPVYRVVYDSPRNPLFDRVTGRPQLHVVSALVTFWQMMSKPRGIRVFNRGMDKIEVLHHVFNTAPISNSNTALSKMARLQQTSEVLNDIRKQDDCEDMSPGFGSLSSEDNLPGGPLLDSFDGDADDDADSAWETDSEHVSDGKIFLGVFAFFNYWDFELFRSAPLSSETRRSIIGDAVDWHLDVPDDICGPISLRATGTSHQITGARELRRCIVEITPFEEPILGIRGWARFTMRQLEFDVEGVFEEQRWVHEAIMLPGCKAVLGRWHDGFDDDVERAVEGPIIWVRQ
ncbi:hypothetical protein V1512DRAFT_254696 [Lipomyces arxii]|uniref:uncharacterized protein n=1 Tax=Lipomyces arxii TaxID=56418 RepID=UPI0034CDEEAC